MSLSKKSFIETLVITTHETAHPSFESSSFHSIPELLMESLATAPDRNSSSPVAHIATAARRATLPAEE